MKRILLILPVILVVGLLAVALGMRAKLVSYLGSEACRVWLGGLLSEVAGVQAEVTRLQPQGLDAIYTDLLTLSGGGRQLMRAEQLRATTRISLWSRQCDIDLLEVALARLNVPPEGWPGSGTRDGGGEPQRVKLHLVTVGDFGGTVGRQQLKGMRLTLRPDLAGDWLFHGVGGVLRLATGQEWKVEGVEGRQRGDSLFVTASRFRFGERGEISVTGETAKGGRGEWKGTFAQLPIETATSHEYGFIPADWRAEMHGELGGDFSVVTSGSSLRYEVRVSLSNGEIAALPLLEQVAKITRIDRFRRLPLHRATATVEQDERGVVKVSKLNVESRGLLRVEGDFVIQDGLIDGTVYVGVPQAVLQWVPGAQERVFTTQREGLYWTPVRLSGMAAHPTEDLSARLMEAAAEESVRAVKESVRESAKGVIEAISPLVPVQLPKIPLLD